MGNGGGRFHSSLSREERKEREKREKRETKEREIVRAAARDRRFSSSKHASPPFNPAGFRSDFLPLYLEFKMTDRSTNALAAKQWFFPFANLFLEG